MFGLQKRSPARDAAWLRAALERYESVLLRYALRKTRDRDEAEDLVQAAFVKLFEHPEIGDADLPQWLFTVITNAFLDGRRAAAVRERHTGDVPVAAAPPSALATLVGNDDLDCLAKALAALTPLQKQAVELRFVEELSYREIARSLDKSESHVGVLLHESLKRLRAKHQEHCGDFLDTVPL